MSAYLSERVAYLRGLSDGLGIKEESAQDKLMLLTMYRAIWMNSMNMWKPSTRT